MKRIIKRDANNFNNVKLEKDFFMNKFKKMKTKQIFCIKCDKFREFENPKIPYIFNRTLLLSIICDFKPFLLFVLRFFLLFVID